MGGKQREMGGKELDLFSEHCYRFEKGNVYVLQAFVIILPELVSFMGRTVILIFIKIFIIILILLIPLLVQ